jgi:hypothetical protein
VAHDLASAITENGLADEQRATAEVAAVFSLGGALLKKNVVVRPRQANADAPAAALTAAAATAGRFGSTGGTYSSRRTRRARAAPPGAAGHQADSGGIGIAAAGAAWVSLRRVRRWRQPRKMCLTPPRLFRLMHARDTHEPRQ